MTNEQREKVMALRCQKKSYNEISAELGISSHTISSFCKKIGLDGKAADMDGIAVCKNCGKLVRSRPGCKPKMFCNKDCRQSWWNSHPEQVNRKANYSFACECCGKTFIAYGNDHRKYCSHACYIAARFGQEVPAHD